jgi:hypothetical protein
VFSIYKALRSIPSTEKKSFFKKYTLDTRLSFFIGYIILQTPLPICVFLFSFEVLGIELRALHMLGKHYH